MPLKLPGPLKNLFSGKDKSGDNKPPRGTTTTTRGVGQVNSGDSHDLPSCLEESKEETEDSNLDNNTLSNLNTDSTEVLKSYSEQTEPKTLLSLSGESTEHQTCQKLGMVSRGQNSEDNTVTSSQSDQNCGRQNVSKEERVVEGLPELESVTSDYVSMTPPPSMTSEVTSQACSNTVSSGSRRELSTKTVVPTCQDSSASTNTQKSSNEPRPSTACRSSDPHPADNTQTTTPKTKTKMMHRVFKKFTSPIKSSQTKPQQNTTSQSTTTAAASSHANKTSQTAKKSPSHTVPVLRKDNPCREDYRSSSATVPITGAQARTVDTGAQLGVQGIQGAAAMEVDVVDGELFPESALSTPVGALRNSRKRLCLMLNIEQPLVETEYTADYRGLADMLGFDAVEIENFWERNPSDTLFMEWARNRGTANQLLPPVLKTLVDCLQKLGREDILEDCRGLILQDVSDFIAEQKLLDHYTVGKLEKFDCYVNIADQDLLTIGREIVETLEGVYGLRLCLTLRDVSLGGHAFEEMAMMLETRCDSKVVIVLSKNYEDSDACQFLTQFAVTLDPGSRKNKLIPLLVDEDTSIPRVLRCLAMLNFYRDRRLGFLWPRLKHAIQS